jgi:hypothetical protein
MLLCVHSFNSVTFLCLLGGGVSRVRIFVVLDAACSLHFEFCERKAACRHDFAFLRFVSFSSYFFVQYLGYPQSEYFSPADPQEVLSSSAWAAAGLPRIPPSVESTNSWPRVLQYIAPTKILCHVAHCNLLLLSSSMHFKRPPPLQLLVPPACSYALSPAQWLQLLCISGHLRLVIRVFVSYDFSLGKILGAVLLRSVVSRQCASQKMKNTVQLF